MTDKPQNPTLGLIVHDDSRNTIHTAYGDGWLEDPYYAAAKVWHAGSWATGQQDRLIDISRSKQWRDAIDAALSAEVSNERTMQTQFHTHRKLFEDITARGGEVTPLDVVKSWAKEVQPYFINDVLGFHASDVEAIYVSKRMDGMDDHNPDMMVPVVLIWFAGYRLSKSGKRFVTMLLRGDNKMPTVQDYDSLSGDACLMWSRRNMWDTQEPVGFADVNGQHHVISATVTPNGPVTPDGYHVWYFRD